MELTMIEEADLDVQRLAEIGAVLAAILDEGDRYRGEGWRTLRPCARALAYDHAPIGHAAIFRVTSEPDVSLYGLGDVAVAPAYRRRGIARHLCATATGAARDRGAGVVLAKTQPLRGVLAELGYQPVRGFDYFYESDGACRRHPDWMALVLRPHPAPVRLHEGDF